MAQLSSNKKAGWERIENPAARRIARKLGTLCGPLVDPDNPDYNTLEFISDPAYAAWVRQRLRSAMLLSRLDEGLSQLPDIREHISPLFQMIESIYRPRNLEGTIIHLARNLEWYLDHSRPIQTSGLFAYQFVVLVVSLVAALLLLTSQATRAGSIPLLLLAGIQALAFALQLNGTPPSAGEQLRSSTMIINCAELYRYLVELHTSE